MALKAFFAAVVFASLLVCSSAGAQTRTGTPSAAPPVAAVRPAQPAARAAARPRAVAPKSSANQPSGAAQAARNRRAGSAFPAPPGLFPNSPSLNDLFGAPVSAATGGPFANGLHSHSGHHDHPGPAQSAFVPFVFGYPYSYDDFSGQPADQAAAQPPASQGDEQLSAEQQDESQATEADNRAADSFNAQPPEPVRDIGNFILIRRDGSTLLACAFSVVGPQLRYITPDGTRRTLPMSDLDVNATQEVNEARGTTLQFQN